MGLEPTTSSLGRRPVYGCRMPNSTVLERVTSITPRSRTVDPDQKTDLMDPRWTLATDSLLTSGIVTARCGVLWMICWLPEPTVRGSPFQLCLAPTPLAGPLIVYRACGSLAVHGDHSL